MDIKIIVAAHKPYRMPEDSMYLPLHVGCENKQSIGFIGDNTGDNISIKNPNFCELTGIYWAFKNLDCEYTGLVHYRRHFCVKKGKDAFDSILTKSQANDLLFDIDCILPKKQKYYIENLYDHYAHTHDIMHLIILEEILKEKYPEYLVEFKRLKKRTSAHMFNMFIMRKDLFNNYCNWLFDILFEVEKRIDVSKLSTFDARLFGRLSELLLDVYIYKNEIKFKEIPLIYTEKINWSKKIKSFLKAKFMGKKYNSSF